MVTEATVLDRVFEVLANDPSPQAIMNLQTTQEEADRFAELTQKTHDNTLTVEERVEVEHYIIAERFVRKLKGKAYKQLLQQRTA